MPNYDPTATPKLTCYRCKWVGDESQLVAVNNAEGNCPQCGSNELEEVDSGAISMPPDE